MQSLLKYFAIGQHTLVDAFGAPIIQKLLKLNRYMLIQIWFTHDYFSYLMQAFLGITWYVSYQKKKDQVLFLECLVIDQITTVLYKIMNNHHKGWISEWLRLKDDYPDFSAPTMLLPILCYKKSQYLLYSMKGKLVSSGINTTGILQ